mmetsp:Transcript_63238/g.142511  ORF Transcript_63238/g.142511 Transcript_63238/m.142511 type:complete len:265 (-) Transcript_63238:83-877(-)
MVGGPLVVLAEPFDAEEVALAHCGRYVGVAVGCYLHKEAHLRSAHRLSGAAIHSEPYELHGLGHAHAVNIGDPPGDLYVVQRGCAAGLGHPVALDMAVSHRHQGAGVACHRGGVQVEHAQSLLPAMLRRVLLEEIRVQGPKGVLRIRVSEVGARGEEPHCLGEILPHTGAHEMHLTKDAEASAVLRVATSELLQRSRILPVAKRLRPSEVRSAGILHREVLGHHSGTVRVSRRDLGQANDPEHVHQEPQHPHLQQVERRDGCHS